ncbi:glycoside hydrolase N-terminal domain-containing protein [Clostridium chauvoei]|uniref:glycosyl hydrolase family 95 catalytic domain-containing protein n=1 Tax=Clostridium chauvoei TaxID=46867 RepID=UPI001C859D73|nr:glycoside hydrolase N-terminal domain-containing protein [Clostridium chauvoei]MBX7363823.1 glycoside hydrolase N-terminal domain-containing protein [Clostridium chauvoei]
MNSKFLKKLTLFITLAITTQGVASYANVVNGDFDKNISIIGDSIATQDKLLLWYDEPATKWESQALPIGNGHIGGMVFGGVQRDQIQYNEKTLWSGGPGSVEGYNGGNKEGAYESLVQIREMLANGEQPSNSLYQAICGDVKGFGSYQNFGNIFLDFDIPNNSQITNYRRELDVEEAISRVKYTYNDINYTREYFTSYPDNVMVIKISSDTPESINIEVRNEGVHEGNKSNETTTVKDNIITLKGELTPGVVYGSDGNVGNGMKYESQIKVVNDGGVIEDKRDNVKINNANSVTLIMAAGTDYKNEYPTYRGEDPHVMVTERLSKAINKGYDSIKDTHLADYKNLFDRVDLKLGELNLNKPTDELLDDYRVNKFNSLEVLFFQYGRYLLISSSREGSLPANLQGIWNNSNAAPWQSDYHFNVNLEMNYWPADVTNLSECAIPLIDYVDSLREPGRVSANVHCGINNDETGEPGWIVNTMNNPFGFTSMGWACDWGWAPTANAWISQNLWENYQFTDNKEYLREKIYPIIKEAAKFWTKFLVEYNHSDGKTYLVSSPSYSPEHGPRTIATTFDQQLVRQLFNDTIKAIEILGLEEDTEFKEELINKRDRLLPTQIGNRGQIQEWKDDINVGEANHRHISHLVGLYPGKEINKDTPELFKAARVTMEERGDGGTGWSMANKINLWARLLDGEKAHMLLGNLLKNGTLDNLFDTHPPFQIDGNLGATSGIGEMLIQSHMDYISLIPAIPNAWTNGSYSGLKARGNFEVSVNWENSNLKSATILSGSGNECALDYPGIKDAIVKDSNGNNVTFVITEEGRIRFSTEKGMVYTIENIPDQKVEKAKGLKAIRNDDNSIKLTWEKAKFADGYNVYRKGEGNDFIKIAENIKDISFIDKNAMVNDNYDYVYYIKAINSLGEGEASNLVTAEIVLYLSDLEWKSATTGWGNIGKDLSVDGNKLTLKGEDGANIIYDKGLGVHATSTIIYDLSDYKYYDYFETYVGVDREMTTTASIDFRIYLDGEEVFSSGIMQPDTNQKYAKVPIKGKGELKLVVGDGGNGIGADHGDWADAKFTRNHPKTNANLSNIYIYENELKDFSPDVYEYTYNLAKEENLSDLKISAIAQNSNAKVEIIKPTTIPGKVTIKVTSADESITKEYSININPYCEIIEDIIAQYDFENINDLGKDISNNKHNGVLNGDIQQVTSHDGKAAQFGSGYITIKSSNDLKFNENFAVETEIYLERYTSYWQKILQKIDNTTGKGGFLLDISPEGKLRFHAEESISQFISNEIIPLNKWVKIKVIFENEEGKAKIYINDKLDKAVDISKKLEISDLDLIIGANGSGKENLKGKINDIKISKIRKEVIIEKSADFNKNGKIDIGDLSISSKYFNRNIPEYDLNNDNIIDRYEIDFIANKILGN